MNKLFLLILFFSTIAQASDLEKVSEGYSSNVSSALIKKTSSFAFCKLELRHILGQDPLLKNQRKIEVKDYRPRFKSGELKTVLLMPPTGGENIIDHAYANELCTHGIRVVLVSHWDYDDEASLDPIMHDRGALRALAAMRNVIDDINPKKGQLGIMGTSVGGISAALAMGVDERISAGFFIVTGGGMADIIARSTEKHLAQLRDQRIEKYHLKDVQDYRDFLAPSVVVDPLDFASRIGNRPTSFIVAKDDVTVPTVQQELLIKEFRSQNVERISGDHFHVILKTGLTHKKKIREFFKKYLLQDKRI